MADFELQINDTNYGDWKEIQVVRSMEQLAHSFSMTLTDRFGYAGDACKVLFVKDGKETLVTTGYIDEDGVVYDANTRAYTAAGRAVTGDLVDCAAVFKGGQWKDSTLYQIAKDLCTPFGIDVVVNTDIGTKFNYFKIEPGERVFNCLDRACRMKGVMMLTTGDGKLSIERVGSKKIDTPLVYGKNILKCSYKQSFANRFSSYKVIAQVSGRGTKGNYVKPSQTTISRTSADSDWVSRYRPTIIQADTEDSGAELQKRVDWERNVRAGKGLRATYTVQGWEHSKGLWEPNRLVTVQDPTIPLDGEFIIASTIQARSETGTTTQIEITWPEAFSVEPLPPKPVKPKKPTTGSYV